MSIKKRFHFQKVLEEYDFMKQKLESNGEDNTDETSLLLNCESLDYEACKRIFFKLRHILTLQTIIVKCVKNHAIVNEVTTANEAQKFADGPVFYTKYALETFYQEITGYLYNSDRIKILAFKNIPISTDLPKLCQGIKNNRSIRVLHFENCEIFDVGCIHICQALRKSPIESLGLESCKITVTAASWLAWLIREQSMLRTLTRWKKYQNDYEYKTEQGIRKLVINDNPGIKDTGAKFIVSTLFDDNWLTHIHMQNTALTDISCHLIFWLLKQNKSLTVFDVARNYIFSSHLVRITQELTKTSTEMENQKIRPGSGKINVKIREKNMKKKKCNIDKTLRDNSQQTSEYCLYCKPFIKVDPNIHNHYLKKQDFKKNKNNILYDK